MDATKASTGWSALTPAERLAALYDGSRPQGMGWLQATPGPMEMDAAEAMVTASRDGYFDYVGGRVIKTNVKNDTLNPHLYDRDNGTGAAEAAIAHFADFKATTGAAK